MSCSQNNRNDRNLPSCSAEESDCHTAGRFDYMLWISLATVVLSYGAHWLMPEAIKAPRWLAIFASSAFDLVNTMWIGVALGIIMVALLSKIPREFVIFALGRGGGARGIIRATTCGVLLDLCNHGILMVAAKLYERGATTGQVIAFLIASPWNSFSLTLVLIALIGVGWTAVFILLSFIIAVVTGLIFEKLVSKGIIPGNPHQVDLPETFHFCTEAKKSLANTNFNLTFFLEMAASGIKDSQMVLRWILFGIVLAGLVRSFVDPDIFGVYFGPTLAGLGVTLALATVLEVCSEGSTPLAADIMTRAKAPGNAFAFLMAGVATDYTEIMVLRDTTRSWRIALFLPLLTIPQVIVAAILLN